MKTQIPADAQLPMRNVHRDRRPGKGGERGTDISCQAVIFDLDGVLVDSTASVEHAWRVWAHRHGLSVNDILPVMHARRSIETMRLVAPQLATDQEAEALNLLQARDTSRDVLVPGALALLRDLPARSWAIVTSGPPVLAHARLQAVGLPVPPVLVTGEDVTQGKPDPQRYLKAAIRLGVPPEHCLVFEDAPVGIAAGQAAGMRVIAVATTYPLSALTMIALAVQTLADVQVKAVMASSKETGHPELVLTISKPPLSKEESSERGGSKRTSRERRNVMVSTSTRPTSQERLATRKLVWVGPLTIVVVALVNLVVRLLAVSFFGVASSFVYLQAPFVIGSTVVFLVLALLAFVLVGRVSRRPVRIFRIVAGVALFVSFLNPLMLLVGVFPATGMNLHIFWTMIVMHTISALLAVSLLTTLAVEQ